MANSSTGKIVGIILGVVVLLGVGAFAFRSQLPASVQKYVPEIGMSAGGDAQTELNAAIAKSFEVESGKFEGKIKVNAQNLEGDGGMAESGGTLTLDLDGAVADAYSASPKVDYSIKAAIDATIEGHDINATAKFDVRMVDDKVFMQLEELQIPSVDANPDLAMAQMMASAFIGKWYAIPMPADQMEMQTEIQKEVLEAMEKIVTENEILIVKKDLGGGKMEVEPNFDAILTADFLNSFLGSIQKAMIADPSFPADLRSEMEADMEVTDEEATEMRQAVKLFWSEVNPKIVVQLDDGYIVGYEISALVDTSKLDPDLTGKIDVDIKTTSSDLNGNIKIETPKEFEELDPSMFGLPGMDPMTLEEAPHGRPTAE